MHYLKNNNTNYFDKYGVLKYSSYLPEKDLPLIQTLQNDNIFIKKKLSEIENRINRHSARAHFYSDRKNDREASAVYNKSDSLSLVPIERPMAATEKKYRSKTAKYRQNIFDGNESIISRKTSNLNFGIEVSLRIECETCRIR